MPSGGARSGSGRKKGLKADLAKALERKGAIATAEEIIGRDLTPLQFMIDVMRDKRRDIGTRMEAAKASAVYVHSKKPQEVILQAEVHIDGVDIAFVGKD